MLKKILVWEVRVLKFKVQETKLEAATKEKYTYGDYLTWLDEERWELIDGLPYNLTPSPSRAHQDISRELMLQLANYLENKKCKVYAAPVDVRLPKGDEEDERIETVVQPDLVVVCDENKLDERGCKGAPDLVIEILSPYTAGKDMKIKRDLYERVGVEEYWLVDPTYKTLQVYKIGNDGKYGPPQVYTNEEEVKVGLFTDLVVDLIRVFEG